MAVGIGVIVGAGVDVGIGVPVGKGVGKTFAVTVGRLESISLMRSLTISSFSSLVFSIEYHNSSTSFVVSAFENLLIG